MEKIQSAIAKARAAREKQALERQLDETDAPARPTTAGDRARAAVDKKPLLETTPEDADAVVASSDEPLIPDPTVNPPERQLVRREAAVDAAWKALPTMAPDARYMAQHRVVTTGGTAESVPIDQLRTKVLQQMRANNWRRLAVTAPSADCGASMVALNLAFSIARQADLRTIVAEVDLRKPDLGKMLKLKSRHQFSDVLAGEASFTDHVTRPRPNMAVASNANSVRNPAELLQGVSVAPALAEIEARFAPDIMIFDMPPMMSSDDTIGFMGHVDCALLVAGAGASTIRQIDICEQDLAGQTNVMGIVLNKCRYME